LGSNKNAGDQRDFIGATRTPAYNEEISLNLQFTFMSAKFRNKNIVCFGEILWDVLPDGAMPGGAPMNVAYHLKKLNHDPQLITRVGHDEWGKGLIQLMERNKISTEYFQMDYTLGTGRVIATVLDNHNVSYNILNPVAWDNIQWEESFEQLVSDCDCFVFGSLITRNEKSRNTLFQLLELAQNKVLDINLRPPFFNKEIVNDLLSHADLLKLNNSELELITGWFSPYDSEEDRMRLLQDRFNILTIVVTKGDKGCTLVNNGTFFKHSGFEVEVSDTIGSGDAYLAGLLSYLLDESSFESAIEYANALGALTATYKGACPDYYENEIQSLINNKLESTKIEDSNIIKK
jgi:fructokinase